MTTNTKNHPVWAKVNEFSIDDPDSSYTFSMRLARENGWTHGYAKKVVEEYKKFMYLSYLSDTPLTPSDEVDQAWHLHLLYTKSYWEDFCALFGKKFHHGPTKGGKEESDKYDEQYQRTLDTYRNTFECTPPVDVWPESSVRFGRINYKRVNVDENIVLNKERVLRHSVLYGMIGVAVVIIGMLTSATAEDASMTLADIFLFIMVVIAAAFLLRGLYRYLTRNNRGGGSGGSTGCSVAGSFFGCGGCSSSSSSGCGSSGCGSSGCGGGGCGGCGS